LVSQLGYLLVDLRALGEKFLDFRRCRCVH
jgi:hypothetical protein